MAVIVTAMGSVTACEDERGARPKPIQWPEGFTEAACRSGAAVATLPVGTTISSELTAVQGDPIAFSHLVTGAEGGDITYESDMQLVGGLSSKRLRSGWFGFLYSADKTAADRSFSYEGAPDKALLAMRNGETLELSVQETATYEGQTSTWDHSFQVTLQGCGTLEWSGGVDDVRVYRAVVHNGSIQRDGRRGEGVATSVVTAYVSNELGWPLRREYPDLSVETVNQVVINPRL